MTSQRPSSESGLTLVELIVAMTLSLVVLFGVFTVFDGFTSSSARQLRVTDAGERARAIIDRVVQDLRHAATIKRAEPNDLWYEVAEPSGVIRGERVCVAADGGVWGASTTTGANPGNACMPSGSPWSDVKIASMPSTNTSFDPLFRYDSTDLSKIKAVGITLSLDPSGGGQTNSPVMIRSSAIVRRAAGTLLATPDDLDADCTSTGALLNLNVDGLGATGSVTVTYATDGGITLGAGLVNVPIAAGYTKVVATITDSLGITQTIIKDVECG